MGVQDSIRDSVLSICEEGGGTGLGRQWEGQRPEVPPRGGIFKAER